MAFRFVREFLIDRIPVLGAFPPQQVEGSPPDFSAALMQARDDAARQGSLAEALTPFLNPCARGGHCSAIVKLHNSFVKLMWKIAIAGWVGQ